MEIWCFSTSGAFVKFKRCRYSDDYELNSDAGATGGGYF